MPHSKPYDRMFGVGFIFDAETTLTCHNSELSHNSIFEEVGNGHTFMLM